MKMARNIIAIPMLIAIAIMLTTSIFSVIGFSNRIYIAFDSCGYEVAKALNTLYPEARGEIFFPWQLSSVSRETVVVVLATNISSTSDVETILSWAKAHRGFTYISTDVLNISRYRIKVDDIWLYCIYKDGEALKRIAEEILNVGGSSSKLDIEEAYILVAVIGVATTSISLLQLFKEKIEEFFNRVRIFIPPILRIKISREEALNHPLRKAIYNAVASTGIMRYTDLVKLGSKASIEWHIWILLRSGILVELKVGRKRYIVDISKASKALDILVQIDEKVKCVIENMEKSPKIVTELCDTDIRSVYSVLELYSKAKGVDLH